MRIHLPLHPHHFATAPVAGPSSSPLVHLGGELVLLELQGELSWQGDKAAGVVGVLGLDRPDKPTLHLGEHHLLHGKIASLPKPYAVIRRVIGSPGQILSGKAVEGDADEEESQLGDEDEYDEEVCPQGTKGFRDNHEEEVDEEDERPLFPSNVIPTTPISRHQPCSSSPIYLPSARRDYSSELDRSSPVRGCDTDVFGSKRSRDDDDDDEGEGRLVKKKRLGRRLNGERKDEERERTRHYEVVGVVRKKVVFALRPEPIVTATVLPD